MPKTEDKKHSSSSSRTFNSAEGAQTGGSKQVQLLSSSRSALQVTCMDGHYGCDALCDGYEGCAQG